MTTSLAAAPAALKAAQSTPSTAAALPKKDEKAWQAEIHTPAAEYQASMPVDSIVPDPRNRKEHDPAALEALAAGIKAEGLLQPIAVRPCPKWPNAQVFLRDLGADGKACKAEWTVTRDTLANALKGTKDGESVDFGDLVLYVGTDKRDAERAAAIYRSGEGWQLIAGERRWLAHRLNGAKTIRAFVHRNESDVSAVSKQVVENLQREDLNPIEVARQMKRLADLGVAQKDIGAKFGGKSQPVVANTLKLLQLPEAVQQLVVKGDLTAAHAAELVRFAAWPKACTLMARKVAECNKPDGWNEPMSAKQLRDDMLPFEYQLVEAKLAVEIYTGEHSYAGRPQYKVSPELAKKPGFFKSGYSTYHYLFPKDGTPNLWEPERAKQDALREAAAKLKQQKSVEAKKAGKPTKEQKERAKKLEDNKAARAAISGTLAHAVQELRETPALHQAALAVVCDRVMSGARYGSELVSEAAAAVGVKIPKGLEDEVGCGDGLEALRKLGAADLVKVAAAFIMIGESREAERYAGAVPDTSAFIAGKRAKTAVDTSVQVVVKAKSGDYKAKAGNAEASATSGAEHAAKAAAAKHFATNSAFIDLLLVQEGTTTGTEKWIYTATKAAKGGAK